MTLKYNFPEYKIVNRCISNVRAYAKDISYSYLRSHCPCVKTEFLIELKNTICSGFELNL